MKKLAFLCLIPALPLPQAVWAQTASGAQAAAPNRPIPASEMPGARELRDAMRRIARNRRDVDALIDAGNAALLLSDADAALNFFRQAENLRPGDGRIKAGLGAAYVRSENPFEGLRYFDEAVKLGVSERVVALDRGMAFDLLGNFERAQQDYQLASTAVKSDRLTIQHAISLSLSGRGEEGDALLTPLLGRNDPAAWRARAFMLAARGEYKESQEVARGFLDIRSAQRIERYLKQMPSLTGPQQAAAIHLGHFPLKNIGRDSDVVRSVAANLPPVSPSGGDSRLIPAGAPLGSKPSENKAPSVAQLRIASAAKASLTVIAVAQKPKIQEPAPVKIAVPEPAAEPKAKAGFDAVPILPKNEDAPKQAEAAPEKTQEKPAPAISSPAVNVEVPKPQPVKIAQTAPPPAKKPETTADNFDLGDIVDSIEIPESEREREVQPVDLSKLPAKTAAPVVEADKPASKPAAIATAEETVSTTPRYWVQIATGDMSAMRGEYRRLSRKYPELFKGRQGWTSPWKTMSRLVVGPFDGYTAAKEWYDALKEVGGDGFVWNSAKGTEVTKLGSK